MEELTHRWGERAGVPHCIPHRFRHSVAPRLLDEGVDIRVVQEILNHADIKETMLYTKASNPKMADAMLRLPHDWRAPPIVPKVGPER